MCEFMTASDSAYELIADLDLESATKEHKAVRCKA